MLTWELAGAVIGAGMASGREIGTFFARYERWGIVGIALAAMVMYFLSDATVPKVWRGRNPEKILNVLLKLLLAATGGAMLSGSGELTALVMPAHDARWCGIVLSFIAAWMMANWTENGLAWVSRLLLVVLGAVIIAGLLLPPMEAVNVTEQNVPAALATGIAYGGFNAALQAPIVAAEFQMPRNVRRRHAVNACGIVAIVLFLGDIVLLRHSALLCESLPFLYLLNRCGKWGFNLAAASLYLAILSTLTACLRGLRASRWAVMLSMVLSLLGFTDVIGLIYPLLGIGCFIMLMAAKLLNCSSGPFHSHEDMI